MRHALGFPHTHPIHFWHFPYGIPVCAFLLAESMIRKFRRYVTPIGVGVGDVVDTALDWNLDCSLLRVGGLIIRVVQGTTLKKLPRKRLLKPPPHLHKAFLSKS
jgi:hypothetical protein